MTLPNYVTLVRIFAVPLIVWLIGSNYYSAAFWVFVAAGVSDGIDGYLARRLGVVSTLGAYLDPLADKALLVAVYVTLGIFALIPGWLVIGVVARDFLIVSAVALSAFLGNPIRIRPIWISKATTTVQIAFAAIILAGPTFSLDLGIVALILTWSVAILTFASAATYIAGWIRHMNAL